MCRPSFLLIWTPPSFIVGPPQQHGDQSCSPDHTEPLLEKPQKCCSSLLAGAGSGARPEILEGKFSKCWIKPLEQMLLGIRSVQRAGQAAGTDWDLGGSKITEQRPVDTALLDG